MSKYEEKKYMNMCIIDLMKHMYNKYDISSRASDSMGEYVHGSLYALKSVKPNFVTLTMERNSESSPMIENTSSHTSSKCMIEGLMKYMFHKYGISSKAYGSGMGGYVHGSMPDLENSEQYVVTFTMVCSPDDYQRRRTPLNFYEFHN